MSRHDHSTLANLLTRLGDVPLQRIRLDPPPGTATDEDVIAIEAREDRLFELIDGVLVEKGMGFYESYLGVLVVSELGSFVMKHKLGIVVGANAMVRFWPGHVRIPDVSFVSWSRLPGRKIPCDPIADIAPDLAVEILNRENTAREMDLKLQDYFKAGVRLVWYIDRATKSARVYTAVDQTTTLNETQSLDGGNVVPGFTLSLRDLFATPQPGK